MVLRTVAAVPEGIWTPFFNVALCGSPRKLVKKRDFRDPIQMESEGSNKGVYFKQAPAPRHCYQVLFRKVEEKDL